jgi:CRP/FNR family transcriptional regulator, cyclic AMP receptor protein
MPVINPELLRKTPLFSLLDDQEIAELSQHLDEKTYLAGQLIFSAGQSGDAMFIVDEGKVELFLQDKTNERVSLGFVEPGELFGEMSLLDKMPRSASAIAITNTHMLIVDREDLLLLVKARPHSALDMMSMLGKRIRDANVLVQSRVTRNVNEEIPRPTNIGEKLSDLLTAIAGDIRFVYFSAIWFFVWIVWNTNIIPGVQAFDPFPFGLLTMVVSLEAIFLSLFVLISQNRGAAREKIRNDIEYEVNLRAEVEVRELMKQMDNMQQLILEHLSALNAFDQRNRGSLDSKSKPSLPLDA